MTATGSPGPLRRVAQPRRLALFAAALVLAGFLVTFIADGSASITSALSNALANTVALAVTAIPVWWLCQRVSWRTADRWWFYPIHLFCAVLFSGLWALVLAIALGITAGLGGDGWAPVLLHGPALHWLVLTAVFVYCAIAAACYAVDASRDAQRAAETLHHAQLHALRAQLDPHLLFNTLHSLLELVRSGDARADDAVDRFARVARYVAQGRTAGEDLVELRAEWDMAQDYVALESLRLGSRLQCRFECDDAIMPARIPALTLQPLIENAITHGIAPRPGAGTIVVRATRIADAVQIHVEDDGLGSAATTQGSGSGLTLVRQRLATHFGDRLTFAAGPRADGTGWAVLVQFPATVPAYA
jgi:signal transduction histidine kinase